MVMDEANILMGNDTTCKIMCIETVKIKMFDGVACMFFGCIVCVIHVYTLLSVGQFMRLRCYSTFTVDFVKLSRGTLVISKGVFTPNNLYISTGTNYLSRGLCGSE